MNMKIKFVIFTLPICIQLILSIFALLQTGGYYFTVPIELHTPLVAHSNDPPTPESLILTDKQGEYLLGLNLVILKDPSS